MVTGSVGGVQVRTARQPLRPFQFMWLAVARGEQVSPAPCGTLGALSRFPTDQPLVPVPRRPATSGTREIRIYGESRSFVPSVGNTIVALASNLR